MKLTTEAYLDPGKESQCEENAGYLAGLLDELIGKTFDGWTVEDDKPAYYIYGQGYADECRPIGAIDLRGRRLADVLRKFAESVADGALSRSDLEDEHTTLTLDVEISDEEYDGGIHVVVSERVADNDEGALYRWTLDQLPEGIWTELRTKGAKR